MISVVTNSPARRLKAVDEHVARIERLLEELRKTIADVAEEVRLAAAHHPFTSEQVFPSIHV